jgi:hypothetical protein
MTRSALLLLALPLLLLCLSMQDPPKPEAAAAPAHPAVEHSVDELGFLSGTWRGGDGHSEWESWYSSPEGGMVVGASKELRGDRAVMIDFEHFYLREGVLRMTPFPKGQRSHEFTLSRLDAAGKQAVFENPENDFPSRFTYTRTDDEHLRVALDGSPGGKPLSITIEFTRRKD